jgi:hypothetical protein
VKDFAQRLDEFETRDCFEDDFNTPFIWEYFGGQQKELNVSEHLSKHSYWSMQGGNVKMKSAVSYLIRHRVLDILVDVMCGENREECEIVAPTHGLQATKRMAKLQDVLADWTVTPKKLTSLMKNHKGKERVKVTSGPELIESWVVQSGNTSALSNIVQSGLGIFVAASQHHSESQLNKCLVNVELATFALSWFAMVCLYCLALENL